MSNRAQAFGMWLLAALFIAALFVNLDLKESGQQYRPLQIIVCGPLALWSAIKGWLLWTAD